MLNKPGLRVVLGLGKTGLACARFLHQHSIPVAVNDTRTNPPALDELKNNFPDIQVVLGGLNSELLNDATEIIISPGLSLKEPLIAAQIARGVSVIGDIELFARNAKAPIVAITGTNAKSTVTTLMGEMAKKAGLAVKVGGNLGTPVLELLDDEHTQLFVLELSSFQLETTYSLQPAAATILNISPDHMDRYSSVEDYAAAKQRIYHDAKVIVFNRDDSKTKPNATTPTQLSNFGMDAPKNSDEFGLIWENNALYLGQGQERLLPVNELLIQGRHNWNNALAALALGHAIKLPRSAMLETLRTFKGLSHRCEWVAEQNNIAWYNDSKGTNIGATIAAIEGLGQARDGKLILIAGGQGKGADFSSLEPVVNHYVRTLVLIGEDAKLIEQALGKTTPTIIAKTMQDAIKKARDAALPGDAVLLSPACASFDMFKNFEHRGEVFATEVRGLLA